MRQANASAATRAPFPSRQTCHARSAVALAVAGLSALAALPAFAQQAAAPAAAASAASAADNERVVVTGTRSPKSVDKIPGAITIISKEELQHTLAVTEDATAVLSRTVPGYAESSQAMSNTGETLRGRIPLRLLDGVPQGSPLREGTRNGTFTDMGLIGRIEVINGPSASEGIGAAGGIINYITRTPTKEGNETTVSARYSSQFKDDSPVWKLGATFAHKDDSWDFLGGVSHVDRGISYDGNGRRIGLNTSGSTADTRENDVFLKGGYNFGHAGEQRVQLAVTKFKITGKGNYRLIDGDRNTGVTNTSERPAQFGTRSEMNDFSQSVLSYTNNDLLGGTLTMDGYYADQFMRFPAEDGVDRQDPLIAPLGTLVDQSEIRSRKKGLRTSYARQDAFGLKGLELRGGVDLTQDTAQQRLALTDRLWVPPMKYTSTAPYLQVSYEIGPVTLSGGYRHEDGKLKVDTYQTTYFRNRVTVQGGELGYKANLPNVGLVWQLPAGFSVFAANSKGFTLPNIGIPLRNISVPGQSVQGILDLQAIIVKSNEVGFNWRNTMASFGGSYYKTKSSFGQSLSIDPATSDFILNRVPVEITGYEFTGEIKPVRDVRVNALYAHMRGKTWFVNNGPLTKDLGVTDVNPDKLGLSGSWTFLPKADVTLGATKLFSRDLNQGTGSEEHTKGYTLFDLSANYDFGRAGRTTLGVENLTNRFYILSWSQVPGFRNYWSGRGRVVSVSHTLTF